MKCNNVQTDMKAFIDSELGWLRRFRVEIHLRVCERCERELLTMQHLTDIVQKCAQVDPPADFRTKVMARIMAEMQNSHAARARAYRSERRFSGWAPAFAFVAGAATVLCINFFTRQPMTERMMAQPQAGTSAPNPPVAGNTYLRVRSANLKQIEHALVGTSPASLKRISDQSFLVEIPQDKVNLLITSLSAKGELLKMQRNTPEASSPNALRRVRVDVVLMD